MTTFFCFDIPRILWHVLLTNKGLSYLIKWALVNRMFIWVIVYGNIIIFAKAVI